MLLWRTLSLLLLGGQALSVSVLGSKRGIFAFRIHPPRLVFSDAPSGRLPAMSSFLSLVLPPLATLDSHAVVVSLVFSGYLLANLGALRCWNGLRMLEDGGRSLGSAYCTALHHRCV